MPGVSSKRSRYRLAAAWLSALWSSTAASARSSKSPPTIGTELMAATGGTRSERSGAIRPRRAASWSGRSSTEAGKTSATCFAISCSVAVMPMYTGSGKLRIAADVFSPSAVCASSAITRWYAVRLRSFAWRANHAYVWIVIGFEAGAVEPARISGSQAVAVALRRQLADELGDEQSPVREDEDAGRAGSLHEAGGRDRLPGRRRMTEAIAAYGARIRADVGDDLLVELDVYVAVLAVAPRCSRPRTPPPPPGPRTRSLPPPRAGSR